MLEELRKLNIITNKQKINPHAFRNNKNQYIKQKIIDTTSFLHDTATPAERIYCILNNITEYKTCYCGKEITKFHGNVTGYSKYCSPKCGNISIEKSKKLQYAHLAKTRNQKKKQVIRIKQSKLKRYGNENYNNMEKNRQTKLERYGDEKYNNIEKFKKTCLERYNVSTPFNSRVLRQKAKETKLEKYGDENYNNQEKNRQTCLERYENENYNNRKKSKQTKLERYENENYNNRDQASRTCLRKYNRLHTTQIHISIDSLDKLNNKQWLIEQHYNQKKTLNHIAKILDVNGTTVGSYLHNHGLEAHLYSQGWLNETIFVNDPNLASSPACLYIIQCYNETESFIKIGVTSRTLKERFNNFKYQYEILEEIELPYVIAWRAEQDILNQFREQNYIPDIEFGGYTECLNEECYEDIIEYLN